MAPLTSSFCQALCPHFGVEMLSPQGSRSCLIQLLNPKQRSSRNVSALQALGARNTNLVLEEQRLPAGVPWWPCTSSCLALTCLCSCWEAAEPPVPAPKALGSNGLEVWELWASVSASGGQEKVKQHWQTCTIKYSSFFSSQRKKRLEEILCCA